MFACMKCSRISRIPQIRELFMHVNSHTVDPVDMSALKSQKWVLFAWRWSNSQSETTIGKLSKSTIQKFANFSCMRIAYGPNSRTFHVANISCSTVFSFIPGDCSEKLGALITCLKRAKMMGIVNQPESRIYKQNYLSTDLWWNVVPLSALRQALCHHDEQVNSGAPTCRLHLISEPVDWQSAKESGISGVEGG